MEDIVEGVWAARNTPDMGNVDRDGEKGWEEGQEVAMFTLVYAAAGP